MTCPFESLVVRNPFVDEIEKFEELVHRCESANVSHLTFTEIPRSYWEIDDAWDPYLNWSVVHTSVLKVFPPALLADWVPADYAARCREIIAQKAAILKKSKVKGAAFLYEPMYWPEAIFRMHPELRGPRVDAPAQAIHPRYAPCVDHTEVLAMYRSAFQQLYELSQGTLDLVIFRTNDSATGFCWSSLYSGVNGPSQCQHISTVSRVKRFLTECEGGIVELGGKTSFYLGGGSIGFPDTKKFADSLRPEFGYYAHDRAREGGVGTISGFTTDFSLYPIQGVPNTWEIMERLAMAKEKGWPEVVMFTCPSLFGHDWQGDLETVKMIEHFNRKPAVRLPAKIGLAREVAQDLYGEDNADEIVESWYAIHQAARALNKNTIGMANLIFYGIMAQRWLTRPLVVYPEDLSEEEEAHYKIHLYQASSTHDQPDLLDQSNARQFDGLKHLEYFNKHFAEARAAYKNAATCIDSVHKRTNGVHKDLEQRLASLAVLECFLTTIHNWLNFHLHLEQVKLEVGGEGASSEGADCSGKLRSATRRPEKVILQNLARAEIDNSLELAALLEANPDCLEMVATAKLETPFILSSELPNQLRRKVEVMLDHITDLDFLTGFKAPAFNLNQPSCNQSNPTSL